MPDMNPQDTLDTNASELQRSDAVASLDGQIPPLVAEMSTTSETLPCFDSRAYHLAEPLGKGGMGEVYRASDPALGRDLAVKVMKSDYCGNDEAERRFLREARVTGSLQHPGIVPVHNLGRLADGRIHYTMRLVRGQTFADILKSQAGKPERSPYLLSIFEKICQAVAYAHSKRVIHRDLKPSNVMVGRFGEVQVMDWGLAKLLTAEEDAASTRQPSDEAGTKIHTESADTPSDVTRPGSGMGTPAYMPREQALGEWDTVDERTDVFALGSILCEMLTGTPAYTGKDRYALERRAKHARPDGDVGTAGAVRCRCRVDGVVPGVPGAGARGPATQRGYSGRARGGVSGGGAGAAAAGGVGARGGGDASARGRGTNGGGTGANAGSAARVAAERRAQAANAGPGGGGIGVDRGGGGGFWWQRWQQERTDQTVSNALAQAELLERQAQAEPLADGQVSQALETARAAAKLAEGASAATRQRAEELVARLEREERRGA